MIAGTLSVVALAGCGGGKSNAAKANDALSAGLKAQAVGDLAKARTDYDHVLSLDPRNKYALFDLGLLDQLAGRTAQAESRYRSALVIDPNFTRALYNLALIRAQPSPQEALSLYQQVISLDPTDAPAYLNLGLLLQSMGQTQQASADIAKAVSLDPSLAQATKQAPQAPSTSTTGPTTTTPVATTKHR